METEFGCLEGFAHPLGLILTCFSLLIKYVEGKLAAETSSVDVVISLVGAPGFHDSDYFQEVARVLKPGGEFVVQEPAALEEKKVVINALCWDRF